MSANYGWDNVQRDRMAQAENERLRAERDAAQVEVERLRAERDAAQVECFRVREHIAEWHDARETLKLLIPARVSRNRSVPERASGYRTPRMR
ncbi:MAG: hypothetical protein ACOVP8_07400 [Phycisphaerales bacterium]|jgi:cell division protein FtsL